MTNSIRHGKAWKISIELRFIDRKIKLYISNDRMGWKIIKKGFGIVGIEDRIKELNGNAYFSSIENAGI